MYNIYNLLVLDENTIKDTRAEIGSWCVALRKQHKVSQIDLATALGLSHKTMANLENGRNFTIYIFLKVIKHFDKQDAFHAYIAA